ncbi:hypothetical protein EDI_212930 [Entamoeba dispar SAW760]|uniref:Mediator of RNA polymerase II transcription subunit 21 n=1 Tax=Entamoeba dispar (strain ATCC PRA-260 / SAW760) TaxID=370354 RepID=B0EJ48_ENTDS|nr:uncharacterized protein EDI_212930 [Entamoeba dispar SAW760]EDR25444.1 hypothetical protein EDI_212930 [Entamoeba dispar SAW760]|eukprot:EDR25444.1 hypothetical protein EDI_212930 [Entamoeba dispar SAW760]
MERQVDIIDQIFANIDYLNDAMCLPLIELTNRLGTATQNETQLTDDDYKKYAKDIIGISKGLDGLIDMLPPSEIDTEKNNDKIKELTERNTLIDAKLKEILKESDECLSHLYSLDNAVKQEVIYSKK